MPLFAVLSWDLATWSCSASIPTHRSSASAFIEKSSTRLSKLHELLHPLTDNDIDKAIQDWNGKIESKHAVVRYMEKHGREKDTAAWLAHEFDGGDGKTPFSVRPESPEGTVLPWPKVQRRIAQLIKEDRFYTEAEQDRFDNIDPSPFGRLWPSAAL